MIIAFWRRRRARATAQRATHHLPASPALPPHLLAEADQLAARQADPVEQAAADAFEASMRRGALEASMRRAVEGDPPDLFSEDD